ncbi:MAG: hypothetical protein IAE81_10590 [Caldilineaceae bacterium]|nr:hypothetical protein [Caldilineaceae bacterium]
MYNKVVVVAVGVALALIIGIGLRFAPVSAQDEGESLSQVQEIRGFLQTNEAKIYRLADLSAGQTLYVRMTNDGGNLDPFVALFSADADIAVVRAQFSEGVTAAIAAGVEPHLAVAQVSDSLALAWSDDVLPRHEAALAFTTPVDGDYLLLARSALTSESFGRFKLLAGLDEPAVVSGRATPRGGDFAAIDRTATPRQVGVEVITGTATLARQSTFFYLQPLEAGDTFYATVAATSGDLRPIITLRDYSGKPISVANRDGVNSSGSFSYTTPVDTEEYFLDLTACCGPDQPTTGDVRLAVGRNAPEVLTDAKIVTAGAPVLQRAIPVKVGVRLQQITTVDQKAENFGAQLSIRMEWTDPALAFDPDACQCSFKTYNGDSFKDFIIGSGARWPEFTLFNQQGNRWTQNKAVVVEQDGHAIYLERATTTFQAPDFDFRSFPFDQQDFYIRLEMLYPREYFVLEADEQYADIGDQLGEEEWYITSWDTQTAAEVSTTLTPVSRYSLHFRAQRHLSYYLLRFFIPLALILLVSWITLFLSNYTRRIEATTGNLLLFIAWNFSIGSDLPRLGYLTFMDVLLLTTFMLNVGIIVYNVILRRMESAGKLDKAQRIDRFAIWLYPVSFFALLGIGQFLRIFLVN